jgi:hypothetical protein
MMPLAAQKNKLPTTLNKPDLLNKDTAQSLHVVCFFFFFVFKLIYAH